MLSRRNSTFSSAASLVQAQSGNLLQSLSLSALVSHSSVQLTQEEEKAEVREGGSLTKSYVSAELSAVVGEIQADGRRERNRWRDVFTMVCLWISYLLCSSGYSIMAPFFPNEAEKKGSSPIFTGIIIGAAPFAMVILSPITGYFLPRLGVRFIVFLGLLLVGSSFFLIGFTPMSPSGWTFITFCIILRLAEGIGSALFTTALFTLLPVFYSQSVGTLTGIFQVAWGLGFCLGPPIGGLLYQGGGFRLPFITVGGLILLNTIPSALLVTGTGFTKKNVSMTSSMFKLITNFTFMVLVSISALSLAGFSFLAPILEPFLNMEFQLPPVEIGLIFFSGALVYMISSFVVGSLSDKFGPRYFLIAGQAVFGFVLFFFGPPEFISSPKIWNTYTCYSIIGLATALTIIPVYSDMLTVSKRIMTKGENHNTMTPVVSGILSSTISIGASIGPLFGGVLVQAFSLQTSSIFLSEIYIAEALLLLGVTVIDRFMGL